MITQEDIDFRGTIESDMDCTLLFLPLSFTDSSLWSRAVELGDVLNYLSVPIQPYDPLSSTTYTIDVGVAASGFDGYNLTEELYNSITWAGEYSFTEEESHSYEISGTIEGVHWLVLRVSVEGSYTLPAGYFLTWSPDSIFATFSHTVVNNTLDDVLAGIDGVNGTINSGFADVNRGQLEIKDGLNDVNTSLGGINNSIQDTNDKLGNIEDILNTDKSDQINSGQFAVDLTYENFALEMIDNSKAGFRDIFDKSGLVLEKYTSSFNFLSAFYTSFFNGFDLANDILYVFISISVTAMLLGSVYTKIFARADSIPVRYSRGPIYKANAYPALKPPKRRSLSSGRN